jgi:hypothetical protein
MFCCFVKRLRLSISNTEYTSRTCIMMETLCLTWFRDDRSMWAGMGHGWCALISFGSDWAHLLHHHSHSACAHSKLQTKLLRTPYHIDYSQRALFSHLHIGELLDNVHTRDGHHITVFCRQFQAILLQHLTSWTNTELMCGLLDMLLAASSCSCHPPHYSSPSK